MKSGNNKEAQQNQTKMKTKRRLVILSSSVVSVLVLAVLWHSIRHEQRYKVTLLPSLGTSKWLSTMPMAINDRGQVVGLSEAVDGTSHLFLWDRENSMMDLGKMDADDLDVNNAGQIAGTMTDPNSKKHAFFWDPNNGMHMLGTIAGGESIAMGLNNQGQVVGFSKYIKDQQAFIWDKTNGMRNVTPDGQTYGKATAINDSGQILGETESGLDPARPKWSPCYWNSIDPLTTPTVTAISPKGHPLDVYGINNNGYVLAKTRHQRKGSHWFCLWHKDAELKWLFPVESHLGLFAFNDANQIVYNEQHSSLLQRLAPKFFLSRSACYLLDPKHGKVFLNNQIDHKLGKLVYLTNINNRGCIIGYILLESSGKLAGVLLEPIPERWDK